MDLVSVGMLTDAGIDLTLARHVAHLFVRDPLVIHQARLRLTAHLAAHLTAHLIVHLIGYLTGYLNGYWLALLAFLLTMSHAAAH